jgi:hypothetical protein
MCPNHKDIEEKKEHITNAYHDWMASSPGLPDSQLCFRDVQNPPGYPFSVEEKSQTSLSYLLLIAADIAKKASSTLMDPLALVSRNVMCISSTKACTDMHC